ncbi:ArsR family transcriptional regulator [Paenibacillus sp. FA6]|uniref:ArsR family transcriptional regulator n=1 Tax=Paenibacillus sp. FA6 TaxID=3413029 RepID=UPI003F659A41
MKDLLNKNISFAYNEALELIVSMGMIACEEQMIALAEDYKLETDPLAISFHEEARARLSPHTLRELQFFFEYNFLHKGLDFAFYESICSSMEPQSAEEWMLRLGHSPAERIVAEMVYGVYHDKMDELLQGMDWEVVKKDIPLLLEIVKKTRPQKEVAEAHAPLLECLAHPEETKVRCIQLIQQFYHDAFSLWKDRLRVESERAAIRYEESFHANPERFIRDHTGTEPTTYDIPTIFHISLMAQVGNDHLVFYTGTSWIGWVIFGIHNDRVFGPAADREKTELFLKAFSDKRRLDILLLLRERPHYGQELAIKLSITPSAVNYHANFLFFLNLLEMKRVEHRMYYHLDIEKLRELLAVTTRVMLDEDY